MESSIKTKRDYNIELLRIIAMFMVIGLHSMQHGITNSNLVISEFNQFLVVILDGICSIANALFIFITGYYLIDKTFKIKKVILLWGRTIFYSMAIFIICLILGLKVDWLQSIFPIITSHYWFISAYIVIYLLSPLINKFLNSLTKNQYKYLLIILTITFGVIRIIFNPYGITEGLLIPTLFMYAIGAYIRKYVEVNKNEKYLTKYFLVLIIYIVTYVILKTFLRIINANNLNMEIGVIIYRISKTMRDFCSTFGIAMSFLLFMKFRTINIKSGVITRIISLISPSIFSIYLIHENTNLKFLWSTYGIGNYAYSWKLVPYLLFLVLSVFIVCLCIDLVRRGAYNVLKKIKPINDLINKLDVKLDEISLKLNNYLK